MPATAAKGRANTGQKRKDGRPQSIADVKRARRNNLAFEAMNTFRSEVVHHGSNGSSISEVAEPLSAYPQDLTAPRRPLADVQDFASCYKAIAPPSTPPVMIDLTADDDPVIPQPQATQPPIFPTPLWNTPQSHAQYGYSAPSDVQLDMPWKVTQPEDFGIFPKHPFNVDSHGNYGVVPEFGNTLPYQYERASAPQNQGVPAAPLSGRKRKIDAVDSCSAAVSRHANMVSTPKISEISAMSKTCSCGKRTTSEEDSVLCAAEGCEHGFFHKACVGLSKRKDTERWRCYKCRPKAAPLSNTAQTPGQHTVGFPPPTMMCPITAVSTKLPEYTPISGEPEPPLHEEQEQVVRAIATGNNVFYTGSAGVGKSTVLKAFVQKLKQKGKHVDIIAPSGIAALNVGGMTIHAYAGWHVDAFKEGLNSLVSKSHGKNVRTRLCQTDVLVIDEISMVERDVLVRLDTIMREIRQTWQRENPRERKQSPHTANAPFGGVQVVVTGDFCQLPPVKPFRFCLYCGGDELPGYENKDGRTLKCNRCSREYEDKQKWAFQSDTWTACKFKYFELRHIHRQSDKNFIDILQKCRFGHSLSHSDRQLLLTPKTDPEGAVKLLPRRAEVDSENLKNYRSLQSVERKFECVDFFSWRNKQEPSINQKYSPLRYPHRPDGPLMALKDHRLEEQISLKEGMLVILITNLDFDSGLVNGSQGKIIGFEKHDDKNVFEPRPSSPPPSSNRRALLDTSSSTGNGSEYAAIKESQVRTFIARTAVLQWPIVEFHNGVVRPIYAECQLGELGSEKPYSLLGRTQIPLLAAWAITVHKSQGMTLNRVIVDLYSSFEKEMVYVALSRARNLEGLKVLRLARQMDSGVNEEVQGFLREHGMLS
nr:isoform 4 of atp-dependent dna helicase pif1 [Quercus suber]